MNIVCKSVLPFSILVASVLGNMVEPDISRNQMMQTQGGIRWLDPISFFDLTVNPLDQPEIWFFGRKLDDTWLLQGIQHDGVWKYEDNDSTLLLADGVTVRFYLETGFYTDRRELGPGWVLVSSGGSKRLLDNILPKEVQGYLPFR